MRTSRELDCPSFSRLFFDAAQQAELDLRGGAVDDSAMLILKLVIDGF
jgi:hypothetical protein